jgi:DNA (cytosine-5)-methyltransferase 1
VNDFVSISLSLDERSPLDFIVMENVPSIIGARGGNRLTDIAKLLTDRGFFVRQEILDAADFGVPQRRRRLFLIAIKRFHNMEPDWKSPQPFPSHKTVRQEIGDLPEPLIFSRRQRPDTPRPHHENHWAMMPRSRKFTDGTLSEGYKARRSFKTLWWDQPSFTVSYGNREVHVHPSGRRRLSVYEGMLLQGFPQEYVLDGSMSSQITQVSEAVPPPLAKAVADTVRQTIQLTKRKGELAASKASPASQRS